MRSPGDRPNAAAKDAKKSPLDRKRGDPNDAEKSSKGDAPKSDALAGVPNSPKASKDEPKSNGAAIEAAASTKSDSPAAPVDPHERWGDLPLHARDVFRSENSDDMPIRYRSWIDS